jgi:precorrin-6A/cobalt-precorrin-6A reductase
MTILLLGGTGEARELASRLDEQGIEVVSSLAGRVKRPRLPVGQTRVGGFGGIAGLADWLRAHHVRAVVDATHPFADGITGNAVAASTPVSRCSASSAQAGRGNRAPRPGPGSIRLSAPPTLQQPSGSGRS